MTGWTALAGTHEFVVPDEARAQALAEALAAHGFPQVTGMPSHSGDDWIVTAFNEGGNRTWPWPRNSDTQQDAEQDDDWVTSGARGRWDRPARGGGHSARPGTRAR